MLLTKISIAFTHLPTTTTTTTTTAKRKTPSKLLCLIPQALQFTFDKVDEIKADAVNAHLRCLGPWLRSSGRGIAYERERFQRASKDAAVVAKEWIQSSARRVAGQGELEPAAAVRAAVVEGIATLIESTLPVAHVPAQQQQQQMQQQQMQQRELKHTPCPETLRFDDARLRSLQNAVQSLALRAALRLSLRQCSAGATDASAMAAAEDRLMYELERLLCSETAGAATAKELADAFGAAVRAAAPASQLAKRPEILDKIVRGLLSYESALFKATARRVMAYVRRALRVASGGRSSSSSSSGGGGGGSSAGATVAAAAASGATVKLKAGRALPKSAAVTATTKATTGSGAGDSALIASLRSAVNADGGAHDATLAPFEESIFKSVIAPAAKLLLHTSAVHGEWYASLL